MKTLESFKDGVRITFYSLAHGGLTINFLHSIVSNSRLCLLACVRIFFVSRAIFCAVSVQDPYGIALGLATRRLKPDLPATKESSKHAA